MPEIEYLPLEDLIEFEGFNYGNYYYGERFILQPQLEKLGYTFIAWGMGEEDSFGPLSRVCKAVSPDGNSVNFVYG